MRLIECDRCHKRINKDAKKTGYINLDQRDIKTGELDGNHDFDEWDLCDDCMEKIRNFVRMVLPVVMPVRQEPDRPGSNVPKQPTVPPMPKGFKAVDVKCGATIKRPVTGMPLTQDKIDQIKQMARDGKTVKEICDCTGVSDPTVRKYKKEVTNETTGPVTESNAED